MLRVVVVQLECMPVAGSDARVDKAKNGGPDLELHAIFDPDFIDLFIFQKRAPGRLQITQHDVVSDLFDGAVFAGDA